MSKSDAISKLIVMSKFRYNDRYCDVAHCLKFKLSGVVFSLLLFNRGARPPPRPSNNNKTSFSGTFRRGLAKVKKSPKKWIELTSNTAIA